MRIDKYLKVSRLIKRRSVASKACAQGLVEVNGKKVSPSKEVKTNDVISVNLPSRCLKVKVCSLKESVKKDDSHKMYEDLCF